MNNSVNIILPFPLTISMDDAGWQGGPILNKEKGGPYRLGIDWDPTLEQYEMLVKIAKESGFRMMTLWVLGELDRSNICAKPQYNRPIAPNDITEFGLQWDNSQYVSDDNYVLMNYTKDNAAWLELGLHAVRHEHWDYAGNASQASEFGLRQANETWGYATYLNVLDCWTELLRQYYDEETCSFPKSFIAPGHKYHFSKTDPNHTTGAAVSSYGVKYTQRHNRNDHFDGSLYSTNRDVVQNWMGLGSMPHNKGKLFYGGRAYLNTHPPNMWDPAKVSTWIKYLTGVNQQPGRYLSKNTVQTYSQILYHRFARRTHVDSTTMKIDNTRMPSLAYQHEILGTLVLKMERNNSNATIAENFLTSVTVDQGAQVLAYWRDEVDQEYILIGNSEQPMGRLEKKVYLFKYTYRTARA